jgi:hypothetical protein
MIHFKRKIQPRLFSTRNRQGVTDSCKEHIQLLKFHEARIFLTEQLESVSLLHETKFVIRQCSITGHKVEALQPGNI